MKREDVVRGQYGEGIVDGQRLKAYRDEDKVAPDSNMETFAALKVFIENFRWAQVPFYLRTGKRLPHKYAEILIKFKKIPGVLYFKDSSLNPNILTIRVQPDEESFLSLTPRILVQAKQLFLLVWTFISMKLMDLTRLRLMNACCTM